VFTLCPLQSFVPAREYVDVIAVANKDTPETAGEDYVVLDQQNFRSISHCS
jgi:hypothetical protein